MSIAIILPGISPLTPGTGKDFADKYPIARRTFEEVDDAVRQNVSGLLFGGSKTWHVMNHVPTRILPGSLYDSKSKSAADPVLNNAKIAQVAWSAIGMAVFRVLHERGVQLSANDFVAGTSSGEHAALSASGSIELARMMKIVWSLADVSFSHFKFQRTGMAVLHHINWEQAKEIVKRHAIPKKVCELSNDNGEEQVLISGHRASLKPVVRAVNELHKDDRKKRNPPSAILPTQIPYHCSLMQFLEEPMQTLIGKVGAPQGQWVSNRTGQVCTDPVEIPRLIAEQVSHTVLWRDCVQLMTKHVDEIVVCGSGRLKSVIKRIDDSVPIHALTTSAEIEDYLRARDRKSPPDRDLTIANRSNGHDPSANAALG